MLPQFCQTWNVLPKERSSVLCIPVSGLCFAFPLRRAAVLWDGLGMPAEVGSAGSPCRHLWGVQLRGRGPGVDEVQHLPPAGSGNVQRLGGAAEHGD